MKTNEKKLADRLVARMAAFLRVVKTKNDRLIAASAKLLRNHARIGPFGLMFSKGDVRRLEKALKLAPQQLLQTAEELDRDRRHEAALQVVGVYELFVPDYAGIYAAQFGAGSSLAFDQGAREQHLKRLEAIARDRRRSADAKRRAMLVLFELAGVERAAKVAVAELADAFKAQNTQLASELMLLIGEFGCYWSPDEQERRWDQQQALERERDLEGLKRHRRLEEFERHAREDWTM